MKASPAIIITDGYLDTHYAKTAHGLIRGTDRFNILAVIDSKYAGQDAGEVLDGNTVDIPIFASLSTYLAQLSEGQITPEYLIVGLAFPGGQLPPPFREKVLEGIEAGLSIVCGLHQFLSDDPEFSAVAEKHNVALIDVRKPKDRTKLRFWTGKIYEVQTPIIAVLGMDCAIGKRTTCRMIMEAFQEKGTKAEMIYTGQTGWMQGYKHGLIFDSIVNDFIGGEIERAITDCYEQDNPDLILVEGQSGLRNPSGPCGSEFILCGNAKAVIVMHAPGRTFYEDTKVPLLDLASELELYKLFGAEVLAIGLHDEGLNEQQWKEAQQKIEAQTGLPCVHPVEDGIDRFLPVIETYMNRFGQ
ncbi:MAG: DUF1611 domain-containing protein [Saprospiraceae bacterium]|nr:DUF1611 domain-containing protein [Saprospiraceae bacterium]